MSSTVTTCLLPLPGFCPGASWESEKPALTWIGREPVGEDSLTGWHLVAADRLASGLCRLAWQGGDAMPESLPAGDGEWLWLPANLPSLSEPGLLLMDMDSTAITMECIDEIARAGGVYDQVAEVTARAMAGGMDFSQALRQRVTMLKGISATVMDDIAANLPLMPGLLELCRALKGQGWQLAVASGGFVPMARALAEQAGLDHFEANTLVVEDGVLSGQISGDIVDGQRKAEILTELGQRWHIPPAQWVAMGDGANDLTMMGRAQLGVGVHAKPKVAAEADVALAKLGLDAVVGLLRP